jgi:class 3 adenylate cyclase
MVAQLTYLFTDLENSTHLWQQAPMAMQDALARHDAIMEAVIEEHNGRVVKSTGDGRPCGVRPLCAGVAFHDRPWEFGRCVLVLRSMIGRGSSAVVYWC